ncbi:MAG: amidohydrolase family protein, partial [SAR324 cluster bacterium]|nr:amidohydrolase family protein [SAR324 cluster bacterium]
TEELFDHFGPDRLLWGSDFSPSLDFLSFPQTFELFNKMHFFCQENIKAIMGENLLRLLRLGKK